jgi:hypothetical protein
MQFDAIGLSLQRVRLHDPNKMLVDYNSVVMVLQ